jgi:hypothetical protein
MQYSKPQLDFIQDCLFKCKGKIISEGIWSSHALLAGYHVEEGTNKMYKQTDNVRTYYA